MPGGYKVILVGIGGATCSGKTTLCVHLNKILPDSFIIHQDDFDPPEELVPFNPVYNYEDSDTAATAVAWDRFVEFVCQVKKTGVIPPDHQTDEDLTKYNVVKLEEKVQEKWIKEFEKIKQDRQENERIIWALLEGYLLYWHKDIIDQMDIKIMLRVPHDVLKQRRRERNDLEERLWPGYWDDVIYPAYVDANKHIFVDGDVERGQPTSTAGSGYILIESLETPMSDVVEQCCSALKEAAEKL